jgi:hypothetical protein
MFGLAAADEGRYDESVELLENAADTFEKLGDTDGLRVARANLVGMLGETARTDEDRDRAIALVREQRRVDTGDPYDDIANGLTLCWLLLNRGHLEEARNELHGLAPKIRSVNAFRFAEDVILLGARHAYESGSFEQALTLTAAREAVARELGASHSSGETGVDRDVLIEELGEATAGRAIAAGLAMTVASALDCVEALE